MKACATCIVLVAATVFLYWPGLGGQFLLDDFHSLEPIQHLNGLRTFDTLVQYISTGTTGPLGRPIPLLTFALNSRVWPADPYNFLLTNIAIHAANACLLFCFLALLLRNSTLKSINIAALASILWAVHPFHVSTVLYVVQRMTLLAFTFSLLTFILYLLGREQFRSDKPYKACVYMLFGLIASICSLLSKESAVLIPLFLLLVEGFRRKVDGALVGKIPNIIIGSLVVSCAVIAIYMSKYVVAHYVGYWVDGTENTFGRTFTMFERLLTEARVLGAYLTDLVFPKMYSSGVFQDNYLVSTSILNPISTVFWMAFHSGLIGLAFYFRRKAMIFFWGVLWFYVGHLLESTVIMLEIKFDHRNYLPSLGVVLVLSDLACKINAPSIRRLIITLYLVSYAFLLYFAASAWGNPSLAAKVWALENPRSFRALEHAARKALEDGDEITAKDFLRREIRGSGSPTAELRFIAAFCESYDGRAVAWGKLANRIKTDHQDWRLYQTIGELLRNRLTDKCDVPSIEDFRLVLGAYRENKAYAGNASISLMFNYEIQLLLFGKRDLDALAIDKAQADETIPLTYIMSRSAVFAAFGHLEYAINRLTAAIEKANTNRSEDAYTMRNASDMLKLIEQDFAGGHLRDKSNRAK